MLTYPYYTRVHIYRICVKIISQPSGEWNMEVLKLFRPQHETRYIKNFV